MNGKNFLKGALAAALLAGCFAIPASAANLGVGTVTGEGLRLRTEPSLQGSVLTEAHKGEHVFVLEQADGWYKVDYGTQVGYMSTGFVSLSAELEADLGLGMVTTGGGYLNLRSAPGTDNPALASLPPRTVVSVVGCKDGWYKVTASGVTGYVSADYITPVLDQAGSRADGAVTAATSEGSELGQAIVNEAMKHLGKAYVSGAAGPNSFDCRGFTYYVYKQVTGRDLPLTCEGQLYNGPGVRVDCALEDCQPGDLLFRGNEPGRPGVAHVAICLGDMKIIHASTPSTGVIITDMKKNGNYQKYYMGVRRLG